MKQSPPSQKRLWYNPDCFIVYPARLLGRPVLSCVILTALDRAETPVSGSYGIITGSTVVVSPDELRNRGLRSMKTP